MYKTLRPLIYRLTPEQAHHVTIALLRLAGSLPPPPRCCGPVRRATLARPCRPLA